MYSSESNVLPLEMVECVYSDDEETSPLGHIEMCEPSFNNNPNCAPQ